MVHPEFHRLGDEGDRRGIIPVYPLTKGLTQKELRNLQDQVNPLISELSDWLPPNFRERYRLAGLSFSLENVHNPLSEKQLQEARYRLVFDEFYLLELSLHLSKKDEQEASGISIDPSPGNRMISSLPFTLTDGQRKTWEDISYDLASSKAMNRLVQGDVGSGKTVIAEAAMFAVAQAGYQAVMMAPTGILAQQHYQTFKRDLGKFGLKIALIHGGMKAAERREALSQLENGELDIVVGTHALIQPDVRFFNLGLVVTDEQHRFGVGQRKLLSGKGASPNVIVMTATPIPRTLAVVLYGEQDISMIDSLPSGRKPIETFSSDENGRGRVYVQVKHQLDQGRQAYIVAPLIEDSDVIDGRSAESLYKEMTQRFPDVKVGLLHGAMSTDEKERIMQAFSSGEIQLLVSTVVIEVGIDVPNATVMVIENAERFGLAQMHQLRGRVGRGGNQSYCYLILGGGSDIAKERVEIMTQCTDGFHIAEDDLRLRGPGEIFGMKQHGIPELRLADFGRHRKVWQAARQAAEDSLNGKAGLTPDELDTLCQRAKSMLGGDVRLEI